MRSGQALTPFILSALSQVPLEVFPRPSPSAERALEFMRSRTSAEGVLGIADPDVLEYPNYSTSYALRCFVRLGAESDRPIIERMRKYLASEQFRAENGFPESSSVFGGWGFGGRHPPGVPGHMDLAHTRRVLEALRESGLDDSSVFARAQTFLRFMQRDSSDGRLHPKPLTAVDGLPRGIRFDGGFFFSPVVLDANKGANWVDAKGPFHGSYATATSDGLLALIAAGVPKDDARVVAARLWLEKHPRWDYPEGVPTDDADRWGDAIYFYHLAARGEAYSALGLPGAWRDAVRAELARHQTEEGSFINSRNHLMKEDDPLLATALAVTALSAASPPPTPR